MTNNWTQIPSATNVILFYSYCVICGCESWIKAQFYRLSDIQTDLEDKQENNTDMSKCDTKEQKQKLFTKTENSGEVKRHKTCHVSCCRYSFTMCM